MQDFAAAAREYEAAYRLKRLPEAALNLGLLSLKLRRPEAALQYCGILTAGSPVREDLVKRAAGCLSEARLAVALARRARARPLTGPTPGSERDAQVMQVARALPAAIPSASGLPGPDTPQKQLLPTPDEARSAPEEMPLPARLDPAAIALLMRPSENNQNLIPEGATEKLSPPPERAQPEVSLPPSALPPAPSNTVGRPREGRAAPAAPPVYKRWWFWTLIGAGVAGTAAGITAINLASGPTSPDPLARFQGSVRRSVEFE
jgi:hypothetical protein